MNPGGGSGWDEPPLDIQVPDDARELDRDVLAYHRELRAKRRRNRLKRLAGPLRPFGPFAARGTVMPLLASILAVCLVAGAMLSVATFSPAASRNEKTPAKAPASSAAPSRPIAPARAPGASTAAASTAAASTAAASTAAASTAAASTATARPTAAGTAASRPPAPRASHSVSPSASSSRTGMTVRPPGEGSPGAPR